MNPEEKKVKIVTGEGQETFVPESIARDDAALKRLLAVFYGTDNFRIERKDENGETVVHVVKMAGAKGNIVSPLSVLAACPGRENAAIVLYRELADVDITRLTPDALPALNARLEEAISLGKDQYQQMESARARLMRSNTSPSSIAIPGF